MKIYEIPTDEALRSQLEHGTADFPFEYYLDEIGQFRGRCIEWHWHREVEFSLVLRGIVRCRTETDLYTLAPGDGLFINSETIHRFDSDDGGIMVSMVFAPELVAPRDSLIYREYVAGILSSQCPPIQFREAVPREKAVLEHISRLYEATGKSPFAIHNRATLLWEALVEFTGDDLSQAQGRGDKLLRARMQKMIQFIHANYPTHIRLSEIAAAANISVSEALRCFHSAMQTTPVSYLNDHRLSRAKDLLLSTTDSVTAIAAATGFENPSYFCRMFKKRYSTSPNQFRKL